MRWNVASRQSIDLQISIECFVENLRKDDDGRLLGDAILELGLDGVYSVAEDIDFHIER